jgi:hypothetical protein
MKKSLLSIVLVVMASMVMAQKAPMSPNLGNYVPSARDNEYQCMPGSVFSQVNPSLATLFYCQAGYPYFRAADDYTATAPFSSLRIWGGDFYGCSLGPVESFDIKIWDGEPWASGNLIYSATLNGTTSTIGFNILSTDVYQIDFDLGSTITQLNGWIGVTRNNASCDQGFAWACYNYNTTGNSIIYDGSWYSAYSDMMFCLGEAVPQEVPVSNWALFIGLGLIIMFTVIRFRKAL